MYSSGAIAREFLDHAERDSTFLTVMKVLKLVYMSHGFNLAITDTPLINDRVEAWKFGPVIPPLYHNLKKFGSGPIPPVHETGLMHNYLMPMKEFKGADTDPDFTRDLVENVWSKYGHLNGLQLSYLTHTHDSPWYKVWHDQEGYKRDHAVIMNDDINVHYKELLGCTTP